MGALLINENRIGVTVLSNHFDGGSGLRNDFMAINEHEYISERSYVWGSSESINEVATYSVTELSLRLLRDTGFYE